MDLVKHLTASRPHGHGWPLKELEATKTAVPIERLHAADHRALGPHAGHTHTELPKR